MYYNIRITLVFWKNNFQQNNQVPYICTIFKMIVRLMEIKTIEKKILNDYENSRYCSILLLKIFVQESHQFQSGLHNLFVS